MGARIVRAVLGAASAGLVLVAGATAAGAQPPPPGESVTVSVPATAVESGAVARPGVATDVELTAGVPVVLRATGTASCGDAATAASGGCADLDANGLATPPAGSDFLAPDLNRYALVGQVGNGPVFAVGTGPTTATGVGRLRLGYNDADFSDNVGGFEVTSGAEGERHGSGYASGVKEGES